MNAKYLLVSSLLALLTAACGSDNSTPATETHSCYYAADGICTAETAVSLVNAGWNAECTSLGGVFGTGCPTANRVGTCTKTVGTPTKSIVFYSPAFTAATGQSTCLALANTTWTPG
jgi:hypothetical protein